MNKTLNEDNFKPLRRIDAAGCRSSLKDGSTIKKEEGKRNRKERLDGLSRRLPSTLCPCWTAQATVRPGYAAHLSAYGPVQVVSFVDAILCDEFPNFVEIFEGL
jgi:hypothetical protein